MLVYDLVFFLTSLNLHNIIIETWQNKTCATPTVYDAEYLEHAFRTSGFTHVMSLSDCFVV